MPGKHLYDCNNPTDQMAIANNHRISQETFEGYLNNFWNTPNPLQAPTVKTWAQMDSATAGVSCMEMRWRLEMNENDMSNNDIILTLEPTHDTETIKNYTIALFKGVKALYENVAEFHFYKAKQADDSADIIFKAVDNINQTVYCGDLSGLYP